MKNRFVRFLPLFVLAAALAASPRPAAFAQGAAPAAPAAAAADADTLSFTFDQVDVRLFTQVVGTFTGRKIVVGDDVEGKITVVSPAVGRDEAYALFAAVLESSGFTIVPEHGLDRVVPAPERPGTGLGPVVTDDKPVPAHGLVTRVLRLEHVSAADMRDMLEAQTQRKGAFAVLQETNHLVFTDTADAARRIESLVRQLDKPGMARVTEVIPLEHADAPALARQLAASFAESQSRAEQLLTRLPSAAPGGAALPALTPPTIIPVEHANRLLVTGSQRQLERVRELVAKLDVSAPADRSSLRPILLDYLRAEDLARNLTTLLEKYAASNPDPARARRIAVEAAPRAGALLVITSSPEDFRAVEDLVRQLDVRPRQVHISVVIAEVQDGASETLGFQFNAAGTYHGNAFGGGSHPNAESAAASTLASVVGSQMFPEGLTAGVVNKAGTTIGAFNLDAVTILAHPSISAENHAEAQVSIVDNIPMTESTVSGTGADRDVVQTITRYDVGVKLALTPHIVPDGKVQMELEPSIEAVTSGGNASDYAPTISKRMVKTVQTARDGETIVIAGLTRADKTTVRRRVPILGSIPLLGWFFRWDAEETRKTNVLIFVTPTVVADDEAAQLVRGAAEAFSGLSAESVRADLSAAPAAE